MMQEEKDISQYYADNIIYEYLQNCQNQRQLLNQVAPSLDTQMPLAILVILTSQKQISSLKMECGNTNKEKSIDKEARTSFQNTNIAIFLIKTNLQQLVNLTIKYQQISSKFIFTTKIQKVHPLHQVIIHEQAGLYFHQLIDKNTDFMLQNYCILSAQELLINHRRFFQNPTKIAHFYRIFKDCFKINIHTNKSIFQNFSPSKMNFTSTEFFLYFFYTIYKNKSPQNQLLQFSILKNIEPPRKISTILQYKFYNIFENSSQYKAFLFYAYFQSAVMKSKQSKQNIFLREVAQWNLLNQDDVRMRQVLLNLEKHQDCLNYLLENAKVNEKMMQNSRISFAEYVNVKFKYIQRRIKTKDRQEINQLLFKFVDHLIEKGQNCKRNEERIEFDRFRERIVPLFIVNQELRTEIYVGQLYNKLKSKVRALPEIGNILLNELKQYILTLVPQLLIDNYESIILPMLIRPELPQENNILLRHFQKQVVSEDNILFIMRVWQEKTIQEYNINAIQFLILKFIAWNQCFNPKFLISFISAFQQQLKHFKVTEACKKRLPSFCEKIANQIKSDYMRKVFSEWLVTVRPDLK